ncbi:MAG: hypothetical protein QS721_06040 [Candidatus Endonucleobacter sp. (ex Gigantidas childressi)]|nr:hypothetical protein [Candidatus Endonucleobacter sp. (ex Gigantidas childressi)]
MNNITHVGALPATTERVEKASCSNGNVTITDKKMLFGEIVNIDVKPKVQTRLFQNNWNLVTPENITTSALPKLSETGSCKGKFSFSAPSQMRCRVTNPSVAVNSTMNTNIRSRPFENNLNIVTPNSIATPALPTAGKAGAFKGKLAFVAPPHKQGSVINPLFGQRNEYSQQKNISGQSIGNKRTTQVPYEHGCEKKRFKSFMEASAKAPTQTSDISFDHDGKEAQHFLLRNQAIIVANIDQPKLDNYLKLLSSGTGNIPFADSVGLTKGMKESVQHRCLAGLVFGIRSLLDYCARRPAAALHLVLLMYQDKILPKKLNLDYPDNVEDLLKEGMAKRVEIKIFGQHR